MLVDGEIELEGELEILELADVEGECEIEDETDDDALCPIEKVYPYFHGCRCGIGSPVS